MKIAVTLFALLTAQLSFAAEPEFEILFEGKNLDGWKNSGNWEIQEDGSVYRKEKGGSLVYTVKKVPDDFEIRFEWKVGPKANSGLYYRPSQYEYQILDNKGHGNGSNPRTTAASLYFCMPQVTMRQNQSGSGTRGASSEKAA